MQINNFTLEDICDGLKLYDYKYDNKIIKEDNLSDIASDIIKNKNSYFNNEEILKILEYTSLIKEKRIEKQKYIKDNFKNVFNLDKEILFVDGDIMNILDIIDGIYCIHKDYSTQEIEDMAHNIFNELCLNETNEYPCELME